MTDDVDITAVWHVKASWSGRASTGFGDDDESGGRERQRGCYRRDTSAHGRRLCLSVSASLHLVSLLQLSLPRLTKSVPDCV